MPTIITKTEFLDRMSDFSLPISFSALSAFLNSPKAFFEYHTKERDKDDEKKYIVGSAFHCLVLEPEKFNLDFAVAPECDMRTNVGKADFKDFTNRNTGKKILSLAQLKEAQIMLENVRQNPDAVNLLDNAIMREQKEAYLLHGFKLHAVKDLASADFVADLKSTKSAEYWSFYRSARDYNYGLQAAIYLSNQPHADFFWIATDAKNCIVYPITNTAIERGQRMLENTLTKLRECVFKNEWHRCNSFFSNGRMMDV